VYFIYFLAVLFYINILFTDKMQLWLSLLVRVRYFINQMKQMILMKKIRTMTWIF